MCRFAITSESDGSRDSHACCPSRARYSAAAPPTADSRMFDAWVFAMSADETTRAAAPPTAERSRLLKASRNISASRRSAHALTTA